MIAIDYKPEHFAMIDPWFKHYNLNMNDFLLPKTGAIVEDCAVGFLFLTNSPQAWIENLGRNPHIDKTIADEALDLVAEKLINMAKDNGVKLIIAETLFNSVIYRSIKHGFKMDENKYTHLYRSI